MNIAGVRVALAVLIALFEKAALLYDRDDLASRRNQCWSVIRSFVTNFAFVHISLQFVYRFFIVRFTGSL